MDLIVLLDGDVPASQVIAIGNRQLCEDLDDSCPVVIRWELVKVETRGAQCRLNPAEIKEITRDAIAYSQIAQRSLAVTHE